MNREKEKIRGKGKLSAAVKKAADRLRAFAVSVGAGISSLAAKLPARPGRTDRSVPVREALRIGAAELGWAAAAFCAVRASPVFGARPFGFALLCAAPGHIPAILCGILAAAFSLGSSGELIAAAAIAAVGLRILVRCLIEPPASGRLFGAMFRESVYLRMATSAVASFAFGFGMLIAGDFALYDLGNTVVSTVTAPIAVLILLPLFRENDDVLPEPPGQSGSAVRDLALIGFLAVLTLSFRGISWLGFAPIHAVITAAILAAARRRGAWQALFAGALCGLAAGWQFAILYGIAGITAGFLMEFSDIAAGTAITLLGAAYGAIFRSPGSFLAIFPAQLTGAGTACLFFRLSALLGWQEPGREVSLLYNNGRKTHRAAPAGADDTDCRAKFEGMSDAFGKIADIYAEFSQAQVKPGLPELREVCDGVCDIYCPGCPKRAVCWEAEYSGMLEMICRMCVSLRENGRVDPAVIPAEIACRCDSMPDMIEAIDFGASSLLRRRLNDCRIEILSRDTRAVSEVLSEALARDRKNRTPDRAKEAAVREALDALGVRYSGLSVTGSRALRVFAAEADLGEVRVGANELRRRLEYAVGCPLTPLTLIPIESGEKERVRDGKFSLELRTRRKYSVCFAAARSAAMGREPENCGDMVCCVDGGGPSGDGYFYAVLCDGMGTGSGAAAAAKVCCDLLRRMLGADMSVEAAIEMLNSLLRSSVGERSVGLDLLRIDLFDGSASIWKSGAAASYLRRGKVIHRIEARSVPVGILNDPEAERRDFALMAGDAVLLTSDGIRTEEPPDAEGGDWLTALLRDLDTGEKFSGEALRQEADEAVRCAVRHARLVGSRDDISAAIVILREEQPI